MSNCPLPCFPSVSPSKMRLIQSRPFFHKAIPPHSHSITHILPSLMWDRYGDLCSQLLSLSSLPYIHFLGCKKCVFLACVFRWRSDVMLTARPTSVIFAVLPCARRDMAWWERERVFYGKTIFLSHGVIAAEKFQAAKCFWANEDGQRCLWGACKSLNVHADKT